MSVSDFENENTIEIGLRSGYIVLFSSEEIDNILKKIARAVNGSMASRERLLFCEKVEMSCGTSRFSLFIDEDESMHIEATNQDEIFTIYEKLLCSGDFLPER